jgi:uroporphyrinogen decarboxylase
MSLFLDVARGLQADRAPVWLMRQAGRYLPEYRRIKERFGFQQMCTTPELAAELTLQPIRRFGFDAAILFSDIMIPLPAMGVPVQFDPGPSISQPIRDQRGIDRLRIPEGPEIAPFVESAIRIVQHDCPVPLIGFAGAPLTLATYLVQGKGSKDYPEFRAFLWQEQGLAHQLLDKLTSVTIRYLQMQVAAGVQAVQLFDSWAGLHGTRAYATFGFPYAKRVLEGLEASGIPRIYIAVDAAHLAAQLGGLPAEVIGVDWRTPLNQMRPWFPGRALQGNLDPAALFAPREVVTREVTRALTAGLGGPHVFNLGHGVLPTTPIDRVHDLVETVRSFDRLSTANVLEAKS